MEQLGLPVLLAMLVGYLLKKNPDISNKLIPVLMFASQFLGRLLFEVSPAEAGIFGSIAKSLGSEGYQMLVNSLASTLLAVGVHSSAKNGGSELLKQLKARLAVRAAELAAKGAEKVAEKAAVAVAKVEQPK